MGISVLWFNDVIEKLYEKVDLNYEIRNGEVFSSCEVDFPDLYFQVNNSLKI
jgi:hypothetical protein